MKQRVCDCCDDIIDDITSYYRITAKPKNERILDPRYKEKFDICTSCFNKLKDVSYAALREKDHACEDCKFVSYYPDDAPCIDCMNNTQDHWEPKEERDE